MNEFRLLKADAEDDAHLLASMHHLRWKVFHQELKWSVGLKTYNCMEFDEYDTDGTYYIVHINDENQVDATCRLMPTSKPYMISDHYPEFVEVEPIPKSDDVWEFSRTCATREARIASGGKITAQLIAAAIEFGLKQGVKNYISLTTDSLYPMLKRSVGWDPQPLGEKKATPNDQSYSLKYTVSFAMLEQIRTKNKIGKPLLFTFDSSIGDIGEKWNDQKELYRQSDSSQDAQGALPGRDGVHPQLS